MGVNISAFASDAVTRLGLPPPELLQSVRLVNVMLRGSSPYTLLTVSFVMLLFAPSTLGRRGMIDCTRHCHLALATGALQQIAMLIYSTFIPLQSRPHSRPHL